MLDGAEIGLVFALIPLFLLDVLLLGAGVFVILRGRNHVDRSKAYTGAAVALSLAALGICAQIAASVYWAAGSTASAALALAAPALLLSIILALLACLGAVLIWRKARRRKFVSLYRVQWRSAISSVAAGSPAGHGHAPFLAPISDGLMNSSTFIARRTAE